MSRTRGYKRRENNFVKYLTGQIKTFWNTIVGILKRFLAHGQKKLTIMIVPHSQKKVLNFQTSIFSLFFSLVLLVGVIFSFFWFTHKSMQTTKMLADIKQQNLKAQASFDMLRQEASNILKSGKNFQSTLSATFSSVGLKNYAQTLQDSGTNGDLSQVFALQENPEGLLKETSELQQLATYLQESIKPVEEMGKLLNSQTTLFSDIPSLWPIKGGIGHVSMAFGQNRHPFTGQWYIHKGIDLSTRRQGDPIIATADGQVVTVEYDPGWGNYVIIKHKHGFYTRYAHLQSYRVSRGEHVQQGQTIGYIGTTGISTGPHLHYEVHIGSDVVDPIKYINIKATGTAR